MATNWNKSLFIEKPFVLKIMKKGICVYKLTYKKLNFYESHCLWPRLKIALLPLPKLSTDMPSLCLNTSKARLKAVNATLVKQQQSKACQ